MRDRIRVWREYADECEAAGDPRGAFVYREVADELEALLDRRDAETVSLTRAAEVSGYSRSYIYKLVRAGRLENVSDGWEIRLRRRDLPKKVTYNG